MPRSPQSRIARWRNVPVVWKSVWRKERVLAPAQKHKLSNASNHKLVHRSNELTQEKKLSTFMKLKAINFTKA